MTSYDDLVRRGQDETARLVVITSAGPGFSAGGDLRMMAEAPVGAARRVV
jgi:enoyl-CoA hydratase/carnithine racemase